MIGSQSLFMKLLNFNLAIESISRCNFLWVLSSRKFIRRPKALRNEKKETKRDRVKKEIAIKFIVGLFVYFNFVSIFGVHRWCRCNVMSSSVFASIDVNWHCLGYIIFSSPYSDGIYSFWQPNKILCVCWEEYEFLIQFRKKASLANDVRHWSQWGSFNSKNLTKQMNDTKK